MESYAHTMASYNSSGDNGTDGAVDLLPIPPWTRILTVPVDTPTASPELFLSVTDNLLRNPNITSSHLFRADILYDSASEASTSWDAPPSPAPETAPIVSTVEGGEDEPRADEAPAPPRAPSAEQCPLRSRFVPHMRAELRPRWRTRYLYAKDGEGDSGEGGENKWQWERTVVRELVPRNEQLDRKCAQSCHFFSSRGRSKSGAADPRSQGEGTEAELTVMREGSEEEEERSLVVYIPHVEGAEGTPFYHPAVEALAVLHTWQKPTTPVAEGRQHDKPFGEAAESNDHNNTGDKTPTSSTNTLTIYYVLHPSPSAPADIPTRLLRTAGNLLRTTAKHMSGRARGYAKRVAHDRVVPQRALQDRYAALKRRHAAALCRGWAEATDPSKHVFEDLGIAAFLIEVWAREGWVGGGTVAGEGEGEGGGPQRPFPGFVDVGCGNGVLVYVLRAEGFRGWGFDARARRTWAALPRPGVVAGGALREMVCVPRPLLDALRRRPGGGGGRAEDALEAVLGRKVSLHTGSPSASPAGTPTGADADPEPEPRLAVHDGAFPRSTFIISNHADELTAWTPLLAALSACPFVAIPCCSHDFSGARFRARAVALPRYSTSAAVAASTTAPAAATAGEVDAGTTASEGARGLGTQEQSDKGGGSRSGSLAKKPGAQVSAYAALCAWVERVGGEVGFEAEWEMLRIPSTRNAAILGRRGRAVEAGVGEGGREGEVKVEKLVREVVEREMKRPMAEVAVGWVERGRKVVAAKGNGH